MKINKILCVVDPLSSAETAIKQSVYLAHAHQSDITFITVPNPIKTWPFDEVDNAQFIAHHKQNIEQTIRSIAPDLAPNILVADGVNFIEIIKAVIRNDIDLLVKCAEDKDWLSSLFGSEDMHLLRKCPCPVLMLKQGHDARFTDVLVTADINDDLEEQDKTLVQNQLNQKVLKQSLAFCLPELTNMHIGGAWEAYGETFYQSGALSNLSQDKILHYVEETHHDCIDKLDSLVKTLKDEVGEKTFSCLNIRQHLVKGDAIDEIPALSKQLNADLVVMGTVGRIGIPGLFIGNTAESILEQVDCSVLAIKPDGFKTPIVLD